MIDRGGDPLSVSLFSERASFIERVLQDASAGGVTMNGVLLHAVGARLPFGGIIQRGLRRYIGICGLHQLANAKPVFIRPTGTA